MIKWNKPPVVTRRRSPFLYIMIAVLAFTAVVRAVSRANYPLTPVVTQCDADAIIKAHYAEVINTIMEQRHYFNPVYDVPKRKPK